jgi:hypothetical protein
VICVCSCKRIPDALLAACISGNSSGVLQLLRAGSSGSPDDLLRYLIKHGHLDSSPCMINMVQLLLHLGITEPALYRRLQQCFPETSNDIQIKATAALVGNCVLIFGHSNRRYIYIYNSANKTYSLLNVFVLQLHIRCVLFNSYVG